MVKSDSHMERIRQRLLDETAGIKKAEEKRREREGKKFGKKVQVEKLKEREKGKKDMEERIRGIKHSECYSHYIDHLTHSFVERKDALDQDEDFDVQLENALTDRPSKRQAHTGQNGKPSMSRKGRDAKYGLGGKVGRRAKQNTKESTDSFTGRGEGGKSKFGNKKGKPPAKRLGKSRRMKAGGK
jgi:rRNA-processing protein EBP2